MEDYEDLMNLGYELLDEEQWSEAIEWYVIKMFDLNF